MVYRVTHTAESRTARAMGRNSKDCFEKTEVGGEGKCEVVRDIAKLIECLPNIQEDWV